MKNDSGFVSALKYFDDVLDSIMSLVVVLAGVWLIYHGNYNEGYALIGVAFGYVAGRSNPKKNGGDDQ